MIWILSKEVCTEIKDLRIGSTEMVVEIMRVGKRLLRNSKKRSTCHVTIVFTVQKKSVD